MQIHPRLGCYFFLAEILTTLPISPDQPMADHCGKCTRCLTHAPPRPSSPLTDLTPAAAFPISRSNTKGRSLEFRRAIGDRIYGCDDCLAACPWNRFAAASSEIAFAARPFVHQWPLRDFLTLTDEAFWNSSATARSAASSALPSCAMSASRSAIPGRGVIFRSFKRPPKILIPSSPNTRRGRSLKSGCAGNPPRATAD